MAALMQADARHTQLLLEARADPNFALLWKSFLGGLLFMVCGVRGVGFRIMEVESRV